MQPCTAIRAPRDACYAPDIYALQHARTRNHKPQTNLSVPQLKRFFHRYEAFRCRSRITTHVWSIHSHLYLAEKESAPSPNHSHPPATHIHPSYSFINITLCCIPLDSDPHLLITRQTPLTINKYRLDHWVISRSIHYFNLSRIIECNRWETQ